MGIHPTLKITSISDTLAAHPSQPPTFETIPWRLVPIPPYFLRALGLGLHSSPSTGCSMTLMGYCAVLPWYPLLQSYETA